MPFRKITNNKFVSPSGRKFTASQVKLYYANGGKFPDRKAKKQTAKALKSA